MSESDLEDIERTLGRSLDPKDKGIIHDLYEIPPDLLEDARKLHSLILSYRLLRFYTSSNLWRWLPQLIDDVLEHNVELQAWVRGGILVPLLPIDTLVTLDVAGILSVLEPTANESWLQVVPERGAWEITESVTGAPAVERPQLRYDSELSEQVRRVLLNGLENLVKVDDIVVATRRWIASRIAGRALKFGGIERFGEPAALFETVFPAVQSPSGDALIATRGALHEIKVLGPSDVEVPGFRGPPEWYR